MSTKTVKSTFVRLYYRIKSTFYRIYKGECKLKKYTVELSLEELEIINGKVSIEAQEVINLAKKEGSYGFSLSIMNELLREAEEKGELSWRYKDIRSCKYCDEKPYDYYRYTRNSRYRTKGEKNYDKPKYYRGIKFNEGFVTIQGQGDMCGECCEKHNVINTLIDYILDKDLKIQIQKNNYKESRYLKDAIRICFNCENEMTESEMGKSSTMMGDGYYPSTCPKCDSKGSAFGNSHKTTNKFKHRLNPMHSEEIRQLKQLVKIHNENNKEDFQVTIGQSKKNETLIFIQELKFRNGYRKVLVFDMSKKIYHIGHFWKDKALDFVGVLKELSYKETDNEYFYM